MHRMFFSIFMIFIYKKTELIYKLSVSEINSQNGRFGQI